MKSLIQRPGFGLLWPSLAVMFFAIVAMSAPFAGGMPMYFADVGAGFAGLAIGLWHEARWAAWLGAPALR